MTPSSGKCLCEKIKISVEKIDPKIGACHCGMCRKWTGGPFLATTCEGIHIEGEDHITVYNSSEWAERCFCSSCGTHLFYRLKANQQHIFSVGFFDSLPEIVFDHQIFIDKKPDFYEFKNQTQNMTEAEVFSKFNSQ